MDGCFSLGVGCLTPSSGHCSRPLGAAGGSPPYQCTRALGGPPSHFGLQPVVLSPRRVHRQQDCSVRSHAPPHSLSAVALGTEKSVARLDRTAGVSPSTTLNVVADGLRCLEPLNTEWTLPPEAFSAILRWADPLQVDLLASPTNYRLPQWVSLFPHPDAVACNCLSIDWNGFASIYAFPPVGLIPTLLPFIRGYRGRLVLVAPWDPQAPWLLFLLQQARDHLHLRTTPYQFCGQGQVFHRLGTSARWTAFLFCEGPFYLPVQLQWSILF